MKRLFLSLVGFLLFSSLTHADNFKDIRDPQAIISYPATIEVSQTEQAQGVFMSCLTFYEECLAFDFNASLWNACELMTFEHCYGYPLRGEFIRTT